MINAGPRPSTTGCVGANRLVQLASSPVLVRRHSIVAPARARRSSSESPSVACASSSAGSIAVGSPNVAMNVQPPVGDRLSSDPEGIVRAKAETATMRNSAMATIVTIENARDGLWTRPLHASCESVRSGSFFTRPQASCVRTNASSPKSAALPERKNSPTAYCASTRRVNHAAIIATPIARTATPWVARRTPVDREGDGSPATFFRSSKGGNCAARWAPQPIAIIDTTTLANAPGQRAAKEGAPPPNAWFDPATTPLLQTVAKDATKTEDQSSPKTIPIRVPITAALPLTMTSTCVSRLADQPTAASTPISCRRDATNRLNKSHSSSNPAATIKTDSARKRPPNGVEPRAASRATVRSARAVMPISVG